MLNLPSKQETSWRHRDNEHDNNMGDEEDGSPRVSPPRPEADQGEGAEEENLPHKYSDEKFSAPQLQLILSRSCYYVGDTVVGAVRLVEQQGRSFSDAVLYMMGECRPDTRWHNLDQVSEEYGTHPVLDNLPLFAGASSSSSSSSSGRPQKNGAICFYATNHVDLLQFDEENEVEAEEVSTENNDESQASKSSDSRAERERGYYVFRVDLPNDIPPTTNALCCRYSYTVIVSAKLVSGETMTTSVDVVLRTSAHSSRCPRTRARTIRPNQSADMTNLRGRIGSCLVTPRPPPRASPLAESRVPQIAVSRTSGGRNADVGLVRIANQEGVPCCLLALTGARAMTPGSRATLQFRFDPALVTGDSDHLALLPCLQIGARLCGEELAVCSVPNRPQSKTRTRTYVFDAAHAWTEPGSTDVATLTLSLPEDCPCTLRTDLLEVNVRCEVELTVGDLARNEVLRLSLPCDVTHDSIETNDDDDGGGGGGSEFAPNDPFRTTTTFRGTHLHQGEGGRRAEEAWEGRFGSDPVLSSDIVGDLNLISLHLTESGVRLSDEKKRPSIKR